LPIKGGAVRVDNIEKLEVVAGFDDKFGVNRDDKARVSHFLKELGLFQTAKMNPTKINGYHIASLK
jgi:FAD synthase